MAKKQEKPKEHKHLFGTSEKSDFILNMTAEGAQKMCGVYSIVSVLLLALMAIPGYFTMNIVDFVDEEMGANHYLSESFIFYTSIIIVIMGIIGYVIFAIAHNKKLISFKDNKSLLAVLAVIILSVISCLNAADVYTALMGYLNRNEGLLTILSFWGLFAVAMCVTADNRRIQIADFIVGIGAFNAIVGILQAVPAAAKFIPNYFENIFVRPGSTGMEAGQIALEKPISGIYIPSYSASGFMSSPFALAAAMSVLFAVAAGGFIFGESKKRKIYYGISAVLMVASSLLTDVLPGVIGIGCAVILLLITAVVKSFSKGSQSRSPLVLALVLTVCTGVMGAVFFGIGAAKLEDEYVMNSDVKVRLQITLYTRRDYTDDLDQWIYEYTWNDGLYTAEQNPILGVGPDNADSMFQNGSMFDRYYNEYIDIMAQRGIPCLICYGIFIIISLVKMVQITGKFIKGKASWIAPAASAGAFAYLVQAFFNITSATATPFMFLAMGLVWSYGAVREKSKK